MSCCGLVAGISIPGAIRYQVTVRGEVFSLWYRGKPRAVATPLAQFDRMLLSGGPSGYLSVCIGHDDGTRRNRYVHDLVLLAFAGPRPTADHEALHGNGCRADNWLHNLRWGTVKENADDRERHGKVHRGDAWYRSRGLAPPWCREEIGDIRPAEEPAHAFADLIG